MRDIAYIISLISIVLYQHLSSMHTYKYYMEIITNLEESIKKLLTDKSKQKKHILDISKGFFILRLDGLPLTMAFDKYLYDREWLDVEVISTHNGIFFKNKTSQSIYISEYMKILKKTSLIGVWSMYETADRIKFYEENNLKLINATCDLIEPFFHFKNGKNTLKNIVRNKKILIVSSHKNSIERQIPFIDKIFEPYTIFENNTFVVLRPPQTLCGNHNNTDWLEHFKKFCKELDEVKDDFDIALVSAGGYGPFICEYIFTNLNKNSIYVGGALQLYFGIMGNRWRSYFKFDTFPNSYWLEHPMSEDIPKNMQIVEEGCYW